MKVRAAIAFEPERPLEIDEIDLEGPGEGECLIRLAATGVCHTDAYTLSGRDPEGLFPVVLGHEGAGVVEEVRNVEIPSSASVSASARIARCVERLSFPSVPHKTAPTPAEAPTPRCSQPKSSSPADPKYLGSDSTPVGRTSAELGFCKGLFIHTHQTSGMIFRIARNR